MSLVDLQPEYVNMATGEVTIVLGAHEHHMLLELIAAAHGIATSRIGIGVGIERLQQLFESEDD